MGEEEDLVLALVPDSEAEYLAASAALESAGIPFLAKNARVQSLFGAGTIGTGFNLLTGPIQIWVHPDDLEAAHQILEEVRLPPDLELLETEGGGDPGDLDEPDDPEILGEPEDLDGREDSRP